jgi:formylmethanofuran dehydrogenase subunit D
MSLTVTLLTGRSLGQASGKVSGKFSQNYLRNVAVCELDPADLQSLGISPGQNIKVTTKAGSVVVRAAVASQTFRRGIAFMPYGPWVNMVTSTQTYGTGMPSFKGIEAQVSPAPDQSILDLRSLVARVAGDGR